VLCDTKTTTIIQIIKWRDLAVMKNMEHTPGLCLQRTVLLGRKKGMEKWRHCHIGYTVKVKYQKQEIRKAFKKCWEAKQVSKATGKYGRNLFLSIK
jgi:hypothetical protein